MDKHVRIAIASRVAQDIPQGACVNLGVGLPTLVANLIPADREVVLQSENGILGRWVAAEGSEVDWDLVDAGKAPIRLLPGGAYFDHATSFAMIRGGHIDICVLGAYQVSENGDLANWHTGEPGAIPAVGGAMDLAAGARKIFVVMAHTNKDGSPKILKSCTFPLTAQSCVTRVYTDMATLEIRSAKVHVVSMVPGVTRDALEQATDVHLMFDS